MAGLRLLRPGSGLVQLSSADICYQLASWGSVLLTDSGTAQPQPIVVGEVTVSGTNPLLAFRAADGVPVTIRTVEASGNSVTYRFQAQSSQAVGVIYWCFDVAGSAGEQITGPRMRAWTTQGVKTFDSAAYSMRLSSSPSGNDVAVIQSMYANRWTFTNMGNTGNGLWVIQADRYQTAARFNGASAVETGLLRYQSTTYRVNPSNGMPNDEEWGVSAHTFVDVSGLPRATMPSQDALAVSVSATVREVTVSSETNAVTISPTVTASASGGTAPYQYEWYRRVGGGGVGPYGPTNTTTFQTETSNQPPGSTWVETWGCRVTDAQGRTGYSPDVVFRHIVVAIDLTPDAISYANVSTATNDPVGFAGVPAKQITGISQPITLRIERFNYSGNADVGYLLCFKGPTANGPWTQVANINPTGTATRYVDFTINNGEWFYFYGQAETTSGRKTSSFDVAFWNESKGHAAFTPVKLSMVVDDNNDFNVSDYNLDPVNFTNLSFYTNSESGGSGGTFGQFTGINRDISVRVAISGRSGSMSSANLGAHSNPTAGPYGSGGPWENYSLNALANSSRDFVVRNGQWMYFDAGGTTSSGRKDHSYTVTLTNMTTGQVIDTFTVNGTVDADNNYNVADYDLDGIDWANIFIDRSSNSWYQEHGHKVMSGINQNITVSMQLSNVSYSGGAFQNTAIYAVSNSRGVLAQQNMANGTSYFTVQPNEQLKFGFNAETTGGRRQFGFDVFVYNATTGAFIDHFHVSGYIGS